MSTYRKRLNQPNIKELFRDYDNRAGQIEWTIQQFKKIEFAACVQVIKKLGPVVLEMADDELETCFDIVVNKTMPTRFALESDSEDQRNENIRAARKRWDKDRNAIKYKAVIGLARKKNEIDATRDDIFAAIRENLKTKNLVKDFDDKQLARILRPFSVLPGARTKK